MSLNLSVKIGNLTLKNPVMPASGTFGYGEEFAEFFNLSELGAIVTKGISLNPKQGNISPRIYEDKCSLLNSIGLENVGLKRFINEKIPFLKKFNTAIIVNFFGNSEDEYYTLAEKLNNIEEIQGLEVNVSCPNVKKGGIEFGLSEKVLYKLIKNISIIADKKVVVVKLSPILGDIAGFGKVVEEAGADGITVSNTLRGVSVDIESKKFSIGNISGGLSGPMLKSVSLKIIYELKKIVKIPVIGVGGVFNYRDAVEYFMCGASAVQVGTANFVDPYTMINIINGVKDFMYNNNLKRIEDFRIC
jgi:dihydroorotate dehydrogenase (NAD+) catalytic subunit